MPVVAAPTRKGTIDVSIDALGTVTPLNNVVVHSRVDGQNHGIVAAVEANGDLVMIAKGPGRVLRLSLAALAAEFGS